MASNKAGRSRGSCVLPTLLYQDLFLKVMILAGAACIHHAAVAAVLMVYRYEFASRSAPSPAALRTGGLLAERRDDARDDL